MGSWVLPYFTNDIPWGVTAHSLPRQGGMLELSLGAPSNGRTDAAAHQAAQQGSKRHHTVDQEIANDRLQPITWTRMEPQWWFFEARNQKMCVCFVYVKCVKCKQTLLWWIFTIGKTINMNAKIIKKYQTYTKIIYSANPRLHEIIAQVARADSQKVPPRIAHWT